MSERVTKTLSSDTMIRGLREKEKLCSIALDVRGYMIYNIYRRDFSNLEKKKPI